MYLSLTLTAEAQRQDWVPSPSTLGQISSWGGKKKRRKGLISTSSGWSGAARSLALKTIRKKSLRIPLGWYLSPFFPLKTWNNYFIRYHTAAWLYSLAWNSWTSCKLTLNLNNRSVYTDLSLKYSVVHRDLQCCQDLLAIEISLSALKKQWFTLTESQLYIFHPVVIFRPGGCALRCWGSGKQWQSIAPPQKLPLFKRNQTLLLCTKSCSQLPDAIILSLIPTESCTKLVLALVGAHWYPELEESRIISPTNLCVGYSVALPSVELLYWKEHMCGSGLWRRNKGKTKRTHIYFSEQKSWV